MVSQKSLEKYHDFVSINSTNGVYNPRKGLESLLSILTPDMKALVLFSMSSGDIYFSQLDPYHNTIDFLSQHSCGHLFPLARKSPWNYYKDKDNDGSLVNIGAVVKYVNYPTSTGLHTGYEISPAGEELGKPIISRAIQFVNTVKSRENRPRYDSMWKILSSIASRTETRKQNAVFDVVKFLIDNPETISFTDIIKNLCNYQLSTISVILNSLGNAGVLEYESPKRDFHGSYVKGFRKYGLVQDRYVELSEKERIFREVKKIESSQLNKKYFMRFLDYIQNNSENQFDSIALSKSLRIHNTHVSRFLSLLTTLGYLESVFREETITKAKANDVTRMLYDILLLPAYESAQTLVPAERHIFSSQELREFVINFNEERTNLGTEKGREVRDMVLAVLNEKGNVKKSHIVQECNERLGEELSKGAYQRHLTGLVNDGIVEKIKRGFYRFCDN
ncbi:MAG: hypothetical protein V1870_01055 [Candidatus Aenigmatarchaeota archaeon]